MLLFLVSSLMTEYVFLVSVSFRSFWDCQDCSVECFALSSVFYFVEWFCVCGCVFGCMCVFVSASRAARVTLEMYSVKSFSNLTRRSQSGIETYLGNTVVEGLKIGL